MAKRIRKTQLMIATKHSKFRVFQVFKPEIRSRELLLPSAARPTWAQCIVLIQATTQDTPAQPIDFF